MPSPIFDAPLTSTLVPTTAGNPAFTFTRATTAYVADQDGILRQAIASEARFQGARRVRNWLIATDFASGWTTPNGTTKTTGVLDPLGGNTAVTMTCTIFPTLQFYMGVTLPSNALQVRNSVWLRIRSGSPVVQMTGGNNVNVTIPVTSTWQRFAVPVTVGGNAGSTTYFHNTAAVSANPGDAIDVWQPQMEVVDGQSNQAPGEYVSVGVLAAPYHGNAIDGVKYFPTTNGNSVAGNIVTEATGSLIPTATLLGYLCENAATNLCLQSQTFDNATWTAENAPIAANDATVAAPDGTLTADKFTDNAVSGTHRTYQAISWTAVTHTFSLYVKQGTLPWVQLFCNAGSNFWANFNLATGVAGNKSAGVTTVTQTLPNGWFRFSITFLAVSGGHCQIFSISTDQNLGSPSYVGTGQTMYLWGAQVETGSDPSSYVPTTTVAVTRNNDVLTYQMVSNVGGSIGTSYAEAYSPSAWASDQQDVLTRGSPPFYFAYYPVAKTLNTFEVSDGALATANTRAIGTVNKNASAWSGTTRSLCLNGGAVATSGFTAQTDSGLIYMGGSPTAAEALRGSIRNVKFYATRLTDSQLIQLTTDGFLPPDVVPVVPSTEGGIGARVRRYRRIEVEIDGEIFPVSSEAEGRELLLKAREAAKQAAQAAAVRAAAKAEKKTSPAAVERALALSTPRISLRADDRSEALAQAIQSQVDAAQAAIDEDYATARRMAYAYVRQRLQDEQRQRELAADEEEVIAMILRLP